jgi:hypothetical protein
MIELSLNSAGTRCWLVDSPQEPCPGFSCGLPLGWHLMGDLLARLLGVVTRRSAMAPPAILHEVGIVQDLTELVLSELFEALDVDARPVLVGAGRAQWQPTRHIRVQ